MNVYISANINDGLIVDSLREKLTNYGLTVIEFNTMDDLMLDIGSIDIFIMFNTYRVRCNQYLELGLAIGEYNNRRIKHICVYDLIGNTEDYELDECMRFTKMQELELFILGVFKKEK